MLQHPDTNREITSRLFCTTAVATFRTPIAIPECAGIQRIWWLSLLLLLSMMWHTYTLTLCIRIFSYTKSVWNNRFQYFGSGLPLIVSGILSVGNISSWLCANMLVYPNDPLTPPVAKSDYKARGLIHPSFFRLQGKGGSSTLPSSSPLLPPLFLLPHFSLLLLLYLWL